jgi:outer membrane protein TolC
VKKILFLLGILSIASVVLGQNAPLSLTDVVDRALSNSFRIEAEQHQVNALRNVMQYEHSQILPQFSGELAREQRYLDPFHFHQQWALMQSEWALGDFLLKTDRAAKQDVAAARANQEQSRLEVIGHVAGLYVSILRNGISARLLQERMELLQAHQLVTQALWQAGSRTELDVLQTTAEISRLNEQQTLLNSEKENLLQEFKPLIGWASAERLSLASLDAAAICEQPVPDFSGTILQANPVLQSLDFQMDAQRLRIHNLRAQQLPHLLFGGGFMHDGDPGGNGNYWQANVGLTVPIFRWNANRYQRQALQATLNGIEAYQKDVQRILMIQTSQALNKLQKFKKVLDLQKDRLRITEKASQIADANYQAGLTTNLEYLSAQQKFSEAQIDIQQTQLDYITGLIDYYLSANQVEKIKRMVE